MPLYIESIMLLLSIKGIGFPSVLGLIGCLATSDSTQSWCPIPSNCTMDTQDPVERPTVFGWDGTPGLCTARDSQGEVLWYTMGPCRVWDSLWRDRVGLPWTSYEA